MLPENLRPEDFSNYPPQAASLAINHLPVFRRMPLSLLPSILRQVMNYDWQFPAEQRSLRRQLDYLESLTPEVFGSLMKPFISLRLDPTLEKVDWVNQPERYEEQFGAELWSSLQFDDYRKTVLEYEDTLSEAIEDEPPAIPRFSLVVIGRGVDKSQIDLFNELRPHGVLFTNIKPEVGLRDLLDFLVARAAAHPGAYAHWYIDGGQPESGCGAEEGVTTTSFARVAEAALQELKMTNLFIERSQRSRSVGPEAVRSYMASLGPAELGLNEQTSDPVLAHFETSLLTEGAGTQIFSTTFVQWAARECLRRAQPLTLLARFAPRQQMAPMNELLKRDPLKQLNDPQGSLIDAEMGAYYTWINQRRLSGADQSRYLAWFEAHEIGIAIAPNLPRGEISTVTASVGRILEWMS